MGTHEPATNDADLRLVADVLARKRESVERFVERMGCVPAMVRFQNRRLGSPFAEHSLADVSQAALAAIWGKLDRYTGRASLESWAFGFTTKELLKALDRRRRSRLVLDGEAAEHAPGAGAPVLPGELEYERVHRGLDRIGPPAAEVVRLKRFAGLTFEEIGQELGMPTNTAKTHYYRCLDRLRTFLGDRGDEK